MSAFFWRAWKDSRLNFTEIAPHIEQIQCTFMEDFWMPDIYFVNERVGHQHVISSTNAKTWIDRDGTISVSSKLVSFQFSYVCW